MIHTSELGRTYFFANFQFSKVKDIWVLQYCFVLYVFKLSQSQIISSELKINDENNEGNFIKNLNGAQLKRCRLSTRAQIELFENDDVDEMNSVNDAFSRDVFFHRFWWCFFIKKHRRIKWKNYIHLSF